MLVLAGDGSNTLAGDEIVMKITSPATATSVTIGVFDGESGGVFDHEGLNSARTARNAVGVPSEYTLYADPAGEGKVFTTPVATWSGSTMSNNAWSDFTIPNDVRAKAPSGAYIYSLKIRNTNPDIYKSYNGFKLRTDGAVALKGYQSFAVFVPLSTTADEAVIYPSGTSNLTNTTYDGTWQFFLDVPYAMSTFAVWDGDMDHGNADGSVLDSDDPDSQNGIPAWAVGTAAVEEGVAVGNQIGGTSRYTTGSPADDNPYTIYTRAPSVWYEVIHPNGTHYENRNPSGNLEWEQFILSTSPFDRTLMDYHVDELPAGVYEVKMHGMDLHNLNAWRFFNDALGNNSNVELVGVTASGAAVIPQKPYNITGTIFYDSDANGVQGTGENGIPSITVFLLCDYNLDGITDETKTTATDANGVYLFSNVGPGRHTVQTDMATLSDDVRPTGDADGTTTANTTTLTATGGTALSSASFAYQRVTTVGTGTRGYWLNHEENWPLTGMYLGSRYYTKAECLAILKRPTKGDKTYSMAAQQIAAKLNLARGTESSCISSTVAAADAWMTTYPVGSKPSEAQWNNGATHHSTLDDYNNGRLCAPHMN